MSRRKQRSSHSADAFAAEENQAQGDGLHDSCGEPIANRTMEAYKAQEFQVYTFGSKFQALQALR